MKTTRSNNTKRASKTTSRVILILAVLAVFTGVILTTTVTKASDENVSERYKYYTTLYIEKGTTLWDIAKEYGSADYEDLNDYIQEVVQINHLKDADSIQYGTTLCIPYYSDEYK